jgi:hypothetical protein
VTAGAARPLDDNLPGPVEPPSLSALSLGGTDADKTIGTSLLAGSGSRGGGRANDMVSLPERITVQRWDDPVVEKWGFSVNSVYSEAVLLPILGPASVFCLRRLSAWATASPTGVEVDTRQLARDLGLGDSLGRNAVLTRTVRRLCHFDMTRWAGDQLWVRTSVAPVPERHLARLSPGIVRLHQSMVDRQLARTRGASAGRARPGSVTAGSGSARPGPATSQGITL